MGRAYEVRKSSILKTGAAKAKLYSMYAKEIYLAAKNGGTSPDSNHELKRLIDRAKKEQVPADLIKRAIDKVTSGVSEDYHGVRYEVFGPGGSTLLIECLTDNVNRTISYIRPALNKNNGKMGVQGSVSHLFDHLSIVSFKGLDEEAVMDALIMADIDVVDIESRENLTIVYGHPNELFKIKEALKEIKSDIEFETDDIEMLPQNTIVIEGEDKEHFEKMLSMLEDVEDVSKVYHNVEL